MINDRQIWNNATSATATGLTNSTEYTFVIRGVNAYGNGTASNAIKATPIAKPAKPKDFAAAPKHQSAILSWTDPNDDSISKWQYSQKTGNNAYGDWTDVKISVVNSEASVNFDSDKWNHYHPFTVKLPAAPAPESSNGVKITLSQPGAAFSPSSLTFTTTNWNTPQTVNVKLTKAPLPSQLVCPENYQCPPTKKRFALTLDSQHIWNNATSVTPTGLTNDTAYTFKIRAINASGNSPESDERTATPKPAPAKPINLAAVAGAGKATLGWSDPGDSTINKWEYRKKTTGNYGAWTQMSTSAAATTFTVTNLDDDTTYTFQIRASNPYGASAASDEATATPLAKPAAPANFKAAPKSQSVILSWNNPNNSSITRYEYRQKEGSNAYGAWTAIANSGASTKSHAVTGLTNGTEYKYKLRAVNLSGYGAESAERTATPIAVPAAPANLRAAASTAGTAKVSLMWDDANNSSITAWQLRQREGTNPDFAVGTGAAQNIALEWTDPNNSAIAQWRLRARRLNPAAEIVIGTGAAQNIYMEWDRPSDPDNPYVLSAYQYTADGATTWKTIPCASPCNLATLSGYDFIATLTKGQPHTFQVRAITTGNAALVADNLKVWTSFAPDAGGTSHTINATLPSGKRYTFEAKAIAVSEVTLTGQKVWTKISDSATYKAHDAAGLEHNAEYTFALRAVNPSGAGDESSTVKGRPVAGAPGAPTLTATGGNAEVALSWTKHANGRWADKWQYRKKLSTASWPTTTPFGWTDLTTSDAARSATITTGIDNGKTYDFQLRAANAAGNGTASSTATASTIPAKPTDFTAVAETDKSNTDLYTEGQVKLSWTDPNNSAITRWEYRYNSKPKDGSYGGYGSWTAIPGSAASTTSYTVTGLTHDTEYKFQVRAVNATGNGISTDDPATGAEPALIAPAAPTDLTATPFDASVLLKWTNPNNSTITSWEYQYKTDGSYGSWTAMTNSDANTASYIVGSLTNGAAHTFKIRAVNSADKGDVSGEVSATPIAVPAAPANLTAAASTTGAAQAALEWTNPSNSSIQKWQYSKDGGTTWVDVPNSSASTTSHTVTNLTNNTLYTFAVRAVNASGNGVEGNATARPVAGAPGKPTLSATGGDGKATLTWTKTGTNWVDRWEYRYKEGNNAWSTRTNISTSDSDRSGDVSGLDNGKTYTFSLRACNDNNCGPLSDEVTVSTIPAKPINLVAIARTDKNDIELFTEGWVDIRWNNPNNSTITGWEYQFKSKPAGASDYGGYGNWTAMAGSGASTAFHTVKGLTLGTEYVFKVRAVNAAGDGVASDESSAAKPTLPKPAAPTGFSATAKVASADLAWTDPGNSSITGWEYRRKPKSNTESGYTDWTEITSSTASTTSYTVENLTNNTLYTFKLRAVNAAGNGDESDARDATPRTVPDAPANLRAEPTTSGAAKATLRWNTHADPTINEWQLRQDTGGADFIIGTGSAQTITLDWTNSGVSNVIYWSYKRRTPGNDQWGNWVQMTTDANASSHSFTTTLTDGTRYEFEVFAVRTGGFIHTATGLKAWETISTAQAYKSHTVDHLTINEQINFRLRAVSPIGNGAEGNASARPVAGAPGKPTLSATGGDGKVTLTWTKAGSNWVDSWQYRYKTTGSYGSWTPVPSSNDYMRSYAVTGLYNGKTYTFQVRGKNAAGDGTASSEVTASTIPAAPANLTAAARSGKTPIELFTEGWVNLSWKNPSNDTITRWEYRHKSKPAGATEYGGYGSWTTATTTPSGGNLTRLVKGLTLGSEYKFQVRAVNATGNGVASDESAAAKPTLPAPAAPTGLTATAKVASAELEWTNPGNSSITSWEYQYKPKSNTETGYTDWTAIQSSTASTTSYTVPSLTNATTYTFQIRAVNDAGKGDASGEKTATPRALPAAPGTLTATATTSGPARATLTWDTHDDPTVNKWQLRRWLGNGQDFIVGTGQAQEITLAWTQTNVENFDQWIYRQRAHGQQWGVWQSISGGANLASHTFTTTLTDGTRYEFDVFARLTTGARYTAPGLKAWAKISPAGPSSGKLSHVANNLTYNILNDFALRAVSPIGDGAESTTNARPVAGVPGAPALGASTGYNGRVTLSWIKGDNRWVDEWQYRQKKDNGSYPQTWSTISADDSQRTITTTQGFINGSTYTFQIRGKNAAGEGTESKEAVSIPLEKPTQPAGLSATGAYGQATLAWTKTTDASKVGYRYQYKLWQVSNDGLEAEPGNAQVVLSWNSPSDTTGITKWQYRKKRVANGVDYPATAPYGWTDIPGSGATTTSYTATGLNNGTTYAFQVRPYTTSAQTALLEASAFPTVSDGWLSVSGSDADTASHAITHLANGKQYKVKLRALNSAKPDGVGPESDAATFATAPAKPAGFKASGGSAQTTLTWDDPKNSTINQWQTRQRANGKGQADFIVGSGSTGQKITLEWTASSAANITKWQYREKAGTANWGAWTDICATTSNADCPATTAHTITTSTALTDGTHYAYQVQATVSTGTAPTVTNLKAWETVKTGATDTSHTVTDLVNGVAYRFQLRAANAAGAGAPANEITSSTDPAPPANLTAEPGNQMVILTWDDPNDPSITAYQYQQKTDRQLGRRLVGHHRTAARPLRPTPRPG